MKHVSLQRISIVDSHTGGEPTRVIVAGAPDCGTGSVAEQAAVFREKHDGIRRCTLLEPRGSNVLVGALLCPAAAPDCVAGVIFFNNVGLLGMCGHGLIGVMRTLAHLGRIGPGEHRIETPVGVVKAALAADGMVSVDNVPSHRKARGILLDLPGGASLRGDIAWGGNWFLLVDAPGETLAISRVAHLTALAKELRTAVHAAGFPEVDHVELCGPARNGGSARNFVLCPGDAYDRSACGTGTSAKLACLAADGLLAPGEQWVQESVIGSTFTAHYKWLNRDAGVIAPTISGRAHLCGEGVLLIERDDPFALGIASE